LMVELDHREREVLEEMIRGKLESLADLYNTGKITSDVLVVEIITLLRISIKLGLNFDGVARSLQYLLESVLSSCS